MFAKIQKYSDQELIQNLNLYALNEKKYLALFIAYLAEVRKRELHFKLGYKSLMEYCQEVLKLDHGQVWVRSQTAGMALDYPLALELIAQGELTLTSASLISPVINQDNADEIFARCRGKSKREVEEVLVCYQPKAELKPSIKPVQRDLFSKVGDVSQEIVTSSPVITQQLKKAEIKPANENRFNFKFSASASLKNKIEQLAQLLNLDPPPTRRMTKRLTAATTFLIGICRRIGVAATGLALAVFATTGATFFAATTEAVVKQCYQQTKDKGLNEFNHDIQHNIPKSRCC